MRAESGTRSFSLGGLLFFLPSLLSKLDSATIQCVEVCPELDGIGGQPNVQLQWCGCEALRRWSLGGMTYWPWRH